VAAVISLDRMFWGAMSFGSDLGGWDTSSVQVMRGMFAKCSQIGDAGAFRGTGLSAWDVSAVDNAVLGFVRAPSEPGCSPAPLPT
jgi:surface protein